MSWWSTLPVVLVAMAILFVPGAIIAWSARAQGFAIAAIAPAISISVLSIAAVLAPMLRISWSLAVVAGLTILISLALFLLTRLIPGQLKLSRTPLPWKQISVEFVAVAIGIFLVGRRLIYAFGRPDAISQTFDNVFHLNAVRYILESGDGSSLTVGAMTGGAFYPAAWHDLVSLVVDMSGTGIPVGVNIVNVCVGAVIWPIGCIFLAQRILGRKPAPTLIAGVLAAAFGAFPILMMDFGVLYPNALGISLLPIAITAALAVCGIGHGESAGKLSAWLLLAAVLPGITLAHPSSTMALLALMIPVVLGIWWRSLLARIDRGQQLTVWISIHAIALAAGGAVALVLWKKIRPAEAAATWGPVQTTGRAIGELISVSQIGRPVSAAIAILVVVGLVVLVVRRQNLWLVGMYAVFGMFFVVATSFEFGKFRTFITGVWYNDPPRLAALLPVVLAPLAVIGAVYLLDWMRNRLAQLCDGRFLVARTSARWDTGLRMGSFGVLALFIIGLAFGTQQANVRVATDSAAGGYKISPTSALLSSDELALIERLDEHVPEDAVIASNPWTGTALAFALADRRTLQLHLISEISPQEAEIFNYLRDANSDPDVCPAIRDLNVRYVLDFGHQEVHGGDHGYDGLDSLVDNGVASVIDMQGDARLLKINACG